MTTKQDKIDSASEDFHNAAAELFDVLKFARSMKSEGFVIEAFGRAVAIARKVIAADERLEALTTNTNYYDFAHEKAWRELTKHGPPKSVHPDDQIRKSSDRRYSAAFARYQAKGVL
jgi:hypothetical protein